MHKGKAIAIHSYKGGTGNTTIITNLAAIYADQGLRICVLDFDLYAPSLSTYFQKTPQKWLNHVLRGDEKISDIILDISDDIGVDGKLFLGLSSPRKYDIDEIEIHHDLKWQFNALKRFIREKNKLLEEYQLDYLFFDTSPGIRLWSINAIGIADILFLMMTINDTNIAGTKQMVTDMYEYLLPLESRVYLLLNRVPSSMALEHTPVSVSDIQRWESELERSIAMPVSMEPIDLVERI